MQKSYNVYNNLGYWFLLLILLVFAGFYTTYFSVIFQPTAPLFHLHFALMAIWIAMLIVQPFLIKYKKRSIHRTLGKVSYVLVPVTLITSFLVIRFSYYRFTGKLRQEASLGIIQLNNDQISNEAASVQAIALYWFLMFTLFYVLAVINRRKSAIHARYMVATALSLLGPTVDRIIFFVFKLEKLPGGIPVETAAFLLADFVLALLLWQDYVKGRPIKTLFTSLLIYIAGQILYFTVPGTVGWTRLVTFIMQPQP